MKEKILNFLLSVWVGFIIGLLVGLAFGVFIWPAEMIKNTYLPVKECIVLRTICIENDDGTYANCATLETYNCEDINY